MVEEDAAADVGEDQALAPARCVLAGALLRLAEPRLQEPEVAVRGARACRRVTTTTHGAAWSATGRSGQAPWRAASDEQRQADAEVEAEQARERSAERCSRRRRRRCATCGARPAAPAKSTRERRRAAAASRARRSRARRGTTPGARRRARRSRTAPTTSARDREQRGARRRPPRAAVVVGRPATAAPSAMQPRARRPSPPRRTPSAPFVGAADEDQRAERAAARCSSRCDAGCDELASGTTVTSETTPSADEQRCRSATIETSCPPSAEVDARLVGRTDESERRGQQERRERQAAGGMRP